MVDPYRQVLHRDNRQFNRPTINHHYDGKPFAASDKWPEPQPWSHSTRVDRFSGVSQTSVLHCGDAKQSQEVTTLLQVSGHRH